MGREHLQNPDVNRGHEPTPNPSGGGESMSGTLAEFPSWEGSGVGRFMERESSRAMVVKKPPVALEVSQSFTSELRFANL